MINKIPNNIPGTIRLSICRGGNRKGRGIVPDHCTDTTLVKYVATKAVAKGIGAGAGELVAAIERCPEGDFVDFAKDRVYIA